MNIADKKDVAKKRRIPVYPGFPELERSDVSIYPTYSKLDLTYRVVCRHRYHWATVKYHKQFRRELHSFERLQPNALDGVRVHREFSQGVLSHKIPRKHMNNLISNQLTVTQTMRLESIIAGSVDFSKK